MNQKNIIFENWCMVTEAMTQASVPWLAICARLIHVCGSLRKYRAANNDTRQNRDQWAMLLSPWPHAMQNSCDLSANGTGCCENEWAGRVSNEIKDSTENCQVSMDISCSFNARALRLKNWQQWSHNGTDIQTKGIDPTQLGEWQHGWSLWSCPATLRARPSSSSSPKHQRRRENRATPWSTLLGREAMRAWASRCKFHRGFIVGRRSVSGNTSPNAGFVLVRAESGSSTKVSPRFHYAQAQYFQSLFESTGQKTWACACMNPVPIGFIINFA